MNSLTLPRLPAAMPDIASHGDDHLRGSLDWVGMAGIHQPFAVDDGGRIADVHGRAELYVDLADPEAKGIHMSRLFLLLERASGGEPLSPNGLRALLERMLDSHAGLSGRAYVGLEFDHFVRRPALKSDNAGWNSYPVRIRAHVEDGRIRIELGVRVTYSSTCPCSAALARQLIQQQFDQDFGDADRVDAGRLRAWLGSQQGIVATPHSQRSFADVQVLLEPEAADFPVTTLIDVVEAALRTPVQAAVKREDEQEFARLNGQNLMFCEDAARRIKAVLLQSPWTTDFRVRVDHQESLHGHDAVAVVTAGVPGGFAPIP